MADERPFVIAHDGSAMAPIVISESATPRTRSAAEDLAELLRQISDATFEIQVGDGSSGIVIGTARDFPKFAGGLPPEPPDDQREEYLLRSHERGLWLIGTTELAAEHAVRDLLHQLGYRQFFPGKTWEVVPRSCELSILVNVTERPGFLTRSIWYGYGPWDHAREAYDDWCRKNRATPGIQLDTGHIYELIHARHKDVFAAHPEYLGLVQGERISDKFCISNPELRKLVVAHALAHFSMNPDDDSLSVEPSDGLGWCECPECAMLGSPSDRAVLLANDVAAAVTASHPGKRFGMYAYGGHVAPPGIDVHPQVVVSVATAFGSAGLTLDELLRGWKARGATPGIREYYSVHPWDRDLPGAARAANLEYVTRTIPHFHKLGARFFSAESSDNWGPCGLGYYVASRLLWDADDATPEHVDRLRADFLDRAFGPAREPMDRFYRLIEGSRRPLLSDDLIGRMYRALGEARQLMEMAHRKPDSVGSEDIVSPDGPGRDAPSRESAATRVLRRIDDLVLYTHYVERWSRYTNATGEARQVEFERLIRHAYRMRGTMLIHTLALYRDVVERDKLIRIPPEAEYHIPEGQNPWKSSEPFSADELDVMLREGIAKHTLLDFDPVSFSDDLVPAAPLKLPAVEPGQYGLLFRDEFDLQTWVETAPAELRFTVKAGLIYGRLGDAKFSLIPRNELRGLSVANTSVSPDRQPREVSLRTTVAGLQRLHLSDGGDGTEVIWPSGTPLTICSDPGSPAKLHGRWTLYFYVPHGTPVIGGFSDGPGELRDPDGRTVHEFGNAPGYFSIPVPAGQDAKLWCFHHGNGQRLLMTVPPCLARTEKELLLPREVVERDQPD